MKALQIVLAKGKDKKIASPFEILKDRSLSDNATVQATAASYYDLMIAAAVVGLVLSIMVIGIMLIWSRRAEARNERKQELAYKSILGIAIGGFLFLIRTIYKIAMVV